MDHFMLNKVIWQVRTKTSLWHLKGWQYEDFCLKLRIEKFGFVQNIGDEKIKMWHFMIRIDIWSSD